MIRYSTKATKGGKVCACLLAGEGFSSSEQGSHGDDGLDINMSAIMRQSEMNSGAQYIFTFSLFSPESQPMGWGHPHSRCVFPLQLDLSGNIFICTHPEVCFLSDSKFSYVDCEDQPSRSQTDKYGQGHH